eukprot:UN09881
MLCKADKSEITMNETLISQIEKLDDQMIHQINQIMKLETHVFEVQKMKNDINNDYNRKLML